MSQQLFTSHDKYHIHKILGFGCLFNYFLRIYWLIADGNMYLYADYLSSQFIPIIHLILSLSSFIFHVPQIRLNSKIIIWKELQLHNIIFTSRSSIIMAYSLICINYNINKNTEYYYLYHLGKFLLIILHHLFADYITAKYNNNDKTTTRDINWEKIEDNVKIILKKYYAICQIFAINALLLTDNDKYGSGVIESSFLIMFPIQLSTFLMTLVRKGFITNISWHIFYALSLLSPFLITINNSKNELDVAKIYLTVLYVIFRLQFNMNKYYLMTHVFILNMYVQYKKGNIIIPLLY